jgi:mRNA interferase RelE/StbE
MLKITLSKQAYKELNKMQPKQAQRIDAAIMKLAENPARTDLNIKKLTNSDEYRLRVGQYRITYTEDGHILEIIKISPRGSAYKN